MRDLDQDHLVRELDVAVDAWRRRGWPEPDVLLVSGSGLSIDLGQPLAEPVPWADLLPFEVVGIEGHPLTAELLEPVPGRVVLSSRGRLHAYQGYSRAQVVFTIRLAAQLGARLLLMTNSSGGLRPELGAGSLVAIADHLNLTGDNPLWGRFPASWGPQFPDMSQAYDPDLRRLLLDIARAEGIAVEEGIYAGVPGPSYETPAEVRMLHRLGADVVGMSTVLEVIAAHHLGMRCGCLSVVANPGAGVTDERLDHADVLTQGAEAGRRVAHLFERLLAHPDLLAPAGV
ncbi:MAG: purine-nucleoside phosphorylase [Acidobacteriota bacterium]